MYLGGVGWGGGGGGGGVGGIHTLPGMRFSLGYGMVCICGGGGGGGYIPSLA